MRIRGFIAGIGIAFTSFCLIYPAISRNPVLCVLTALAGVFLPEILSQKKFLGSQVLIAAMFLALWVYPYGFFGGLLLWVFCNVVLLPDKKAVFYLVFGYSIGIIFIFK